MGYTIPEGVDTMLDVIGVGWPNVDEDAYRDMADALREFADDADDDGHAAHRHIQRLLSSGQSESLTALDAHWSKVQGKHKDLAKAARIIAGALDRVADLIVARKMAAVGELADLCATVGITLAFAPLTAGLSTLLAGAKIAATRIAFKRILKEMAEAAVAEIVATLTEPAVAAIENVVADLAIQAALNVVGVQNGIDTDRTVQAGKDGLQLNSAPGAGGPGPGGGPVIDHDAHGDTGTHLAGVQVSMRDKTGGKLTKAKSHHGRAKGKDSLTAVLDTTIEGVTEKLGKALGDLGDHVGKTLPNSITASSKTHKDADQDVRDGVRSVKSPPGKDKGVPGGGGGGGGGGNGGGPSGGGPNGKPLSPQPGWHGKSAGKMKHHRRDALDVNHLSEEQQRAALVRETRDLADSARDQEAGHNPPGKDRLVKSCAGGLLHEGTLTSHSSSTKRHGQTLLDTHPALKSVVDQVEKDIRADNENPGAGHGKCAEIALVSDRLHGIEERDNATISTPEDIRRVMSGALVYSLQIGEQDSPTGLKEHGDYKEPCRSCSRILPLIGVEAHS
ncbi:YwqJ-related putative deaminase [Streptomyces sp. NBC_01498]|uniref:YwqJ-related putative deaminase n=1 Tax=Streptomyces sp. NBC_01498 TaxID=2975870 RepID=UPI002E7B1CBE|nr:YwqJ-related putative deaminase [Streptomyces sp. NBC_01498]WTL26323.1 YwqJ-related putative deaminase [Streptomyces sp. NBC_01498]